jgi:hypothetical protein
MADWQRLRARYAQLTWRQRLANLASTLRRAGSAAADPRTAASARDLLREGAWIIEWSQSDTPIDVLAQLAPIQLELVLLHAAWDQAPGPVRPLLTFRTSAMSERLLELSQAGGEDE